MGHFHMDLMAVMSRTRQTLARPCTRTLHGRIISCAHRQQKYPYVRMSVNSRWHGIADFGRSCGSNTLAPGHYGDDRAEPDQLILALKAWVAANDERFLERGCRLRT